MPPNTVDLPLEAQYEIHNMTNGTKIQDANSPRASESSSVLAFTLKVTQSSLSLIAHVLIGSIVTIVYSYAFRNGTPIGSTPMHASMCVMGYQLLMAEAILSLSPEGGFSSKLSLVHRRRVHWILQIAGSGIAIAGTLIKILDSTNHFNTWHGITGLIAMIFTSFSLMNGLGSLYSSELRKIMPGKWIKILHICFGTIAFISASICLCLGLDKNAFKIPSGATLSQTAIAFTSLLTAIVIINPLLSFYGKFKN